VLVRGEGKQSEVAISQKNKKGIMKKRRDKKDEECWFREQKD